MVTLFVTEPPCACKSHDPKVAFAILQLDLDAFVFLAGFREFRVVWV